MYGTTVFYYYLGEYMQKSKLAQRLSEETGQNVTFAHATLKPGSTATAEEIEAEMVRIVKMGGTEKEIMPLGDWEQDSIYHDPELLEIIEELEVDDESNRS